MLTSINPPREDVPNFTAAVLLDALHPRTTMFRQGFIELFKQIASSPALNITVLDEHILTAVEIESIIVEVVVAKPDGNRIEMNVLTVDQVQSPESWTLTGDSRKGEILTILHSHQTRTDASSFYHPLLFWGKFS